MADTHVQALLDDARDDPEMCRGVTRKRFHDARRELVKAMGADITMGDVKLDIVDFVKGVATFANTNAWSQAIREAYAAHPCVDSHTAWQIIWYADEIVPGNVLRLDHRRKCLCVYASFAAFHSRHLACADLWLPLGICRNFTSKKICGGYSNYVKNVLRNVLADSGAEDRGIRLTLHCGTALRIHVKAGAALVDGDAFRFVWSVKGSSGVLPCILCRNVTTSPELIGAGCGMVGVDEPLQRNIQVASSASIYMKADQLAALHADRACGRISKEKFKEAEVCRGIVYRPDGVMYDDLLRNRFPIAEVAFYDSMHNMFANGIVQAETSLLLQRLHGHLYTFADLRTFAGASNWCVASAFGRGAKFRGLFSLSRETHFKNSHHYNPSASDMLLSMPLILHFAITFVGRTPAMDLQLRSYRALRDLVLITNKAKLFQGACVADQLDAAVEKHLALRRAAYPATPCIPKHHFNRHLGRQVRKLGKAIDCFVGERKNAALRRVANLVANGRCWERSVLFRAVGVQLHRLKTIDFSDKLHPKISTSLCGTVRSSRSATLRSMDLAEGDAIRAHTYVLVIRRFEFDDANGLRVRCDAYEFREQVNSHAAAWVRTLESVLVKVKSFELVVLYYRQSNSRIVVLD